MQAARERAEAIDQLREFFGNFKSMHRSALAKAMQSKTGMPSTTCYRRIKEFERIGVLTFNTYNRNYEIID